MNGRSKTRSESAAMNNDTSAGTLTPTPIRPVGAALLAAVLLPVSSSASDTGVFQHGGRGTGQVGALTARADEPSAVTYNPAGLTELEGLQVQIGVERFVPSDELRGSFFTSTGSLRQRTFEAADESETVPSFYLTWRSSGPGARLAFGIGLDSPMWMSRSWPDADFPAAGSSRRYDAQIRDLHPVVAFRLSERWSAALGVHLFDGTVRDDNRNVLAVTRNPGTVIVHGERTSHADVDGEAYDLSLQYRADGWGLGAVLRSGAELDGRSANSVRVSTPVPPGLEETVARGEEILRQLPERLELELPPELRFGAWKGLGPRLRLEVDLALRLWSEADNALVRYFPGCGDPPNCPDRRVRDWDDTLAVRSAVEWQASSRWSLFAGLAFEPSPVPAGTLEPGFPRGDRWVGGLGVSAGAARWKVDVGYSLHDHRDRDLDGTVYSASEQVLSVSTRWRIRARA